MATKFIPKIALVGSGMIGTVAALVSGLQQLSGDIVMLDVVPDMPSGKALDLSQALAATDIPVHACGASEISEDCAALAGSDVIIVTAGFPRKPGMSRDDLLGKNAEVIQGVGKAIKKQCPNAFVICITNPLDVMVSLLQRASGLPPQRVVGMAGMLDSARFRFFIADALNVSVRDVNTCVLGGHGDDMVPLLSATSVNGIPIKSFVTMGKLSQEQLEAIVTRTRLGGGEIVNLLKLGSAFIAPAVCAVEMAKSYLRDERRVMPCCAMLTGQYGFSNIYAGVPCVIGARGVEEVIELPLEAKEMEALKRSIESVSELRKSCRALGFDA